jgi:hypothetical protein
MHIKKLKIMNTTVWRFSIPRKEADQTVIKFIGSLLERGNINM